MAEPTFHAPDESVLREPAAAPPARPPHDRELPVTATPEDGASGQSDHAHQQAERVAGDEESPGSASASAAGQTASAAATPAEGALTEDQVKLALRKVKDPELNLNILDLGLVYDIRVDGTAVAIDMSLTSPGCPSGPEIMTDAERQLKTIPGVTDVSVNLVWSPYWTPDRIEPRVRAYLGF